jgi:DUF4097 and DUF4098 domain-containing protein YvlB
MPEARMAPVRPPRSFAGPIVLILLGVVCLMGTMHMISAPRLLWLFSRYWPLLIILWGGIKLVEYYQARHAGTDAPRIGAGSVILVIFLVLIGMTATGASRVNWGAINDNVQLGDGDNEVINFLGGKTFTYDSEKVTDIGSATSLRVNSNRGGVTVLAWDEPRVKVVAHKKVIASSEDDAKKLDESTQPTINIAGSLATVDTNTNVESRVVIFGADIRYVRTDVEVYVPKKLALQVDTRHGDVTVRDRAGDVRIGDQHGDVTLEQIVGNVTVDLSHGDLRATNVNGDVAVSGRLNDTTLADVTGSARFSGEFFGDMNLSKIAKGVTFRSSRTDMTLARLDGDLSLQSSDLKVKSVVGPFRLSTRAKDIHLEDMNGDVQVQNTNGVVEIASTKPGKISVENRNNDVIVTLPAKAAFQYNLKARQGEISSDFPDFQVNNTERHENSASGSIGSGGPRVDVTNQHGNVEIRKS